MKKPSTVLQGTAFEEVVFRALRRELQRRSLGLLPSAATIHRHHSYFSRDRQSNVIVDVSIEVRLPGSDEPSFLWICECKDYSHPVPVDDVEEFKAKLDQIAGKNVKGVFASTASLQRSALAYARANGIGVLRFSRGGAMQWTLRSALAHEVETSVDTDACADALTADSARDGTIAAIIDDAGFASWRAIAEHIARQSDPSPHRVGRGVC